MDDTGEEMLTGNCERCEWYIVRDSYPELVKAYQQHLRGEHPTLWLRR
jgi:predicted small metal-binding protein